MNTISSRAAVALLVVLLSAACLPQPGSAYYVSYTGADLTALVNNPPISNWLLTPRTTSTADGNGMTTAQRAGWKKIGAKVWWFLSNLDFDTVNAEGQPTPPTLAGATRVSGRDVTCGRNARMLVRLPFHDCGTFDIGFTGSVGDAPARVPRFGCNGSLRKEVAPCTQGTPKCVNGVEAAIDPTTGTFLAVNAFDDVKARLPVAQQSKVDWGQPPAGDERPESTGFANNLAFIYQLQLEAQAEGVAGGLPTVSFADVLMYAGMLAVAKCNGPQIEFQQGRADASTADGGKRLPEPTEELHLNVAYFWTNGVTNMDMVNLLAAHSVACFGIGCQDATPSGYDPDWARQLLQLTGGRDENICQFDAAGNPPTEAKQMCFLPADAEFAGRADTRRYLEALASSDPNALAAAANVPYSPFSPVGSCPSRPGCTARPATWVPFRVLPVNMCTKSGVTPVGCAGNAAQKNFNDAVATSYFKMSKWYRFNSNGVPVVHAFFDVRQQPCQPGLFQIASANEAINPVCSCCPEPLPQCWKYDAPSAALSVAAASVTAAPATEADTDPFPAPRARRQTAMPAEPNPTAEQLKAAAVTPDVASIVAAAPVVEEEAGVVQPAASVAEAAELLP